MIFSGPKKHSCCSCSESALSEPVSIDRLPISRSGGERGWLAQTQHLVILNVVGVLLQLHCQVHKSAFLCVSLVVFELTMTNPTWLVFARLVFARLVLTRLVFARLVFSQLILGRKIRGPAAHSTMPNPILLH